MTPGHESIDYEKDLPACEDPTLDEEVPKTWLEAYREQRGMIVAPKYSRDPEERDERKLLADVAFNRHTMNDGHHVSPFDNGTMQIGTDGITVDLVQGIDEDAFKRTLSAATRATIGIDIDQPAALDPDADWEEMLKGGLQTALESQVIVFAVKGVSRTCTHQLVRSRRAAFHQQSQRASWMGDAPEFRMPESVAAAPRSVRNQWYKAVLEAWKAYGMACEADVSYQDARFILPEGTCNFIMLEYPVREFLNVYAYRACSMFQWEIVEVMRKCREVLVAAHPWIAPYVKISCEKTGPTFIRITEGPDKGGTQALEHHCTFQGWEDVEGQCDFPWAKHEARTFKPAHHRISREK